MQDTQSRTEGNSQLPSSEQHLTFFTCRIPSPGQEIILFYFFHVQDTQFRTGENFFFCFHMQDAQSRAGENTQLPSSEQHLNFFTCRIPSPGQDSYLPLISHAGYPVHDRRKLLATFLWATFKFFHMQDTQSRTGENYQLPSSEQHLTFFTCRIPSPGQEKILSYLPMSNI